MPLALFGWGRKYAESTGTPLYVDASIRREPDLESEYPSISSVCRAGKFAKRLQENDIVIYITHKSIYKPLTNKHWRIPAILQVVKRFEDHLSASQWYKRKNIPVPSNCMIHGNPPFPLTLSLEQIQEQDDFYRERVDNHGVFLVSTPLFLNIINPPVLTEVVMKEIFNRLPGTSNPGRISKEELDSVLKLCQNKGPESN